VKRTIEVLNELEKEGVFSRYAIGGAMGAIFYTEPFLTFDLDVFVVHYFEENEHDVQGCRRVDCIGRVASRPIDREIESQCVAIEGVPVQFLPAYNSLIEEALMQARETDYEGVPTRVLKAEYLIAICLRTGRSKDRARVAMLREQAQLDMDLLAEILKRYELVDKWMLWTE
jgi:hypothetical protein